jgi:hypothetical protein
MARGPDALNAMRLRPRWTLAAAALLFVAVFLLRLGLESPSLLVTFLFALPIAMVAVELGVGWGLAAGGVPGRRHRRAHRSGRAHLRPSG